jgi:hypothetical protein
MKRKRKPKTPTRSRRDVETLSRPEPRHRSLAVFSLTLVLLSCLTHDTVFMAGNETSRFAQIEALVDYGHTYIDESRYRQTIDRVEIDGKRYSNKPPLLSVLGAGVYFLLKHGIGLTFASNQGAVIYLLTLILIGLPMAWLVARFDAALPIYPGIKPTTRNLTTIALAAGTILTSFAVTFSNHPVAAALLFAACQAAWSGRSLAAGVWLAALTLVDIVPGLVFAPFLGLVLRDAAGTKSLYNYIGALCAGAVIFVALNEWIVGYPLPAKMVPGAVDSSIPFAPGQRGMYVWLNLPPMAGWSHWLQSLFGWHGFFTVSPVLLFGVCGLILSMRRGQAPLSWRTARFLGIASLIVLAGHVLLVGSFGGWSYGYRYMIPVIPIGLFFVPKSIATERRLFGAVLAISIFFAFLGAYHPWPPVYEPEYTAQTLASVVTNPVGGNLSAWLAEYFPDLTLTRKAGEAFISPNVRIREPYLGLFYASKNYNQAP